MKTISEVIIHPTSEKNASYVYSRINKNMFLQTFRRFGESFDYCRFCGEFLSRRFCGESMRHVKDDCPCGGRETVNSGGEMRRHIKEALSRGEIVEIKKQEVSEQFETVLKNREKEFEREKKYVLDYEDSNSISVTFNHYGRYAITGFTDPFGEAQIKIVVDADYWPPPYDTYITLETETYYCRVTGINNEWDIEVDKFAVGKYWPTGGKVEYPFEEILIDKEKAKKIAHWAHNTMRHGFTIKCLREGQNDGE